MPLPMTKGALNRLGVRLIAAERVSEPDLQELAVVLGAYQEVLDRVKAHLQALGFSATGRVKTTGTLTDKLRRSHEMQLSRMQDLAGARIVVSDLRLQDEASEKIRKSWEDQGCPCKVVDRRERPSFGYRAVHIVVQIDAMPVEIQVRTELQDAWAQIVERLGDRWGRGIRYGEGPENPEAVVRSGELVTSRREAVHLLMELSDTFARIESARLKMINGRQQLASVSELMARLKAAVDKHERGVEQRMQGEVPPEVMSSIQPIVEVLERFGAAEDQALPPAGESMTGAQAVRMIKVCHDLLLRQNAEGSEKLQDSEQRLRAILQLIADATDEGE